MNEFVDSLVGEKVLVFGLGRQGGGAGDAQFLTDHGAQVRLSDRDLSLCSEGQTEEQIDWADLIIKNPGVPDDHPLLQRASQAGKSVYTSIALYVKYATIPVIGITGTRGKSTTTALISHLLNTSYPEQIITGGNIPGTSGLALFDAQAGKKYAVLELSSFQLHNFHDLKVSPPYAVITNLYPDHLNRYVDMESYQRDKEAIGQYQKDSDHCLFNSENKGAVNIARVSPGIKHAFSAQSVVDWDTPLPGLHNSENIAAMWALAQVLGISERLARQAVQSFPGLPFRQEIIRQVGEVTYINDTTATTPTATLKAIYAQTEPTILILGGASKNLPDQELIDAIVNSPHIVGVIILGSLGIPTFTTSLHERAPAKILDTVKSMSAAVKLASDHATPHSRVLLSPGFASFDLFQNEFDRGRQFNEAVSLL